MRNIKNRTNRNKDEQNLKKKWREKTIDYEEGWRRMKMKKKTLNKEEEEEEEEEEEINEKLESKI